MLENGKKFFFIFFLQFYIYVLIKSKKLTKFAFWKCVAYSSLPILSIKKINIYIIIIIKRERGKTEVYMYIYCTMQCHTT